MNRRQNHSLRLLRRIALRLSLIRSRALLPIPYILLGIWLFWGGEMGRDDFAQMYEFHDSPAWKAPNAEHLFGTAANGADLWSASRRTMASSVLLAGISTALGAALALLITLIVTLDSKHQTSRFLEGLAKTGRLVPVPLALVILLATNGNAARLICGMAILIVLPLSSPLHVWIRQRVVSFDLKAERILGFRHVDILRRHLLPTVWARLLGASATYLPAMVLLEMALSYLNLVGQRPSVGLMISHGEEFLIEAPWLLIYPGVMASAVVMALSLMGWWAASILRSGLQAPFP